MAQPPILNCNTTGYTGKNVLFDVAFACGDVADPKALSYMPVGGMKTKDLDMGQDTTDATTDATAPKTAHQAETQSANNREKNQA